MCAYLGEVKSDARKRKIVVILSDSELAVVEARAEAVTQGNVSRYVRIALGFEANPVGVAQAKEVA